MNEPSALAEAMKRLRRTPTGAINDALAMDRLKGSAFGIWPSRGFEDTRIAGPALTLRYAPTRGYGALSKTVYDIFYESEPGQIVVIDGGGAEYSFAGDNQGHAAMRAGMEGFVVDGYSRDVAGFRLLGLPLFIKGPTTRIQTGLYDLVSCGEQVEIGGVLVNPGDIVVGDADGVIVIPRDKLDLVLTNLDVIDKMEVLLEDAIAQRRPVAEVKAILAMKKPR
jgi:regulator of RNase E activity RraA